MHHTTGKLPNPPHYWTTLEVVAERGLREYLEDEMGNPRYSPFGETGEDMAQWPDADAEAGKVPRPLGSECSMFIGFSTSGSNQPQRTEALILRFVGDIYPQRGEYFPATAFSGSGHSSASETEKSRTIVAPRTDLSCHTASGRC